MRFISGITAGLIATAAVAENPDPMCFAAVDRLWTFVQEEAAKTDVVGLSEKHENKSRDRVVRELAQDVSKDGDSLGCMIFASLPDDALRGIARSIVADIKADYPP